MGRGNLQVTQRRCSSCNRLVKAEKNSLNWGTGDFLLIVLSFGLWIPLKIMLSSIDNPWRCSQCGTKV